VSHKEILDELRLPVRDLREKVPAVFAAYGELNTAVFTDGALDAKTKQLIVLAIAMSNAALREFTPT
jgi:alkylhydroperoxidase/carboxymuconolactone decarboxylase family protein YurZ